MDKIKRDALELATRSFHGRPAHEIVDAATVFEAYLRAGSPDPSHTHAVHSTANGVIGFGDQHQTDTPSTVQSQKANALTARENYFGKQRVNLEPGALYHGDIKP